MSVITVWEIYERLERICMEADEPITVEKVAEEFRVSADILIEYLVSLEILEVIDFSDKRTIVWCKR
jgi:hypothetical protein